MYEDGNQFHAIIKIVMSMMVLGIIVPVNKFNSGKKPQGGFFMKKMFLCFVLFVFPCLVVLADGNETRILQKIEDCKAATGETIKITGTSRSVRRQAELMAKMTNSQLNWYGSSTWYVEEMKKSSLTGSARVDEFEQLITTARKQGSFVSRHLTADAVDIAPASSKVKNWLLGNGISIKDETVDGNNCWHLELTGYGNY